MNYCTVCGTVILDLTDYNWYSGTSGKAKNHFDAAHNSVKGDQIPLPASRIIMEGLQAAIEECIDEGTLPHVS